MAPPANIPVVDISGLYSSDIAERKAVSHEIGKAIQDVGFLYIKGYDIPQSTILDAKSAAEEFFALSFEEKMNCFVGDSKSSRGFVPEGEEIFEVGRPPDRKEAIAFGTDLPDDHPLVLKNIPFHGHNPNVPSLPTFKPRVMAYFNALSDLAHKLIRAFALTLGLPETELDQYFTDALATLRLLHYPFRPDLEDVPGIGAHEDFECLTLLYCDAPGLEIYAGNDEWVDVLPIPETLILNIGGMFDIMSNGRLKPKTHRVRAVKEERYSMPFFFGGNYFTEMRPLPQFAGSQDQEKALDTESPVMGDHVWSAFIQNYRHTCAKIHAGEIKIPKGTKRYGAFAQEAAQTST